MVQDIGRGSRQIALLEAIRSGGGLTVRDAATLPAYAAAPTRGAFTRRFERDLAELREAGYPIEVESRNGNYVYVLRENAPVIAAVGSLGVGILRSVMAGAAPGTPHLGSANNGIEKLLAASPPLPARMTAVRATIPTGPAAAVLARAIQQGRQVRFRYRRTTTETKNYLVEPWQISVFENAFYVSGVAHTDSWVTRTFKVDRIDAASVRVGGAATQPRRAVNTAVFHAPTVILAIRPGSAAPLRERGRTIVVRRAMGAVAENAAQAVPADVAMEIPAGWDTIRLSYPTWGRLWEDLAMYRGSVRLVGDADALAEWHQRTAQVARAAEASA